MPTDTDRFVLLIVWALSVGFDLIGGTDPGFRPLNSGFQYPWWPVARTCAVVTVESVVLYLVLQRAPFRRRARRAFAAATLAFGVLAFEMFFQRTDQAGWTYTNSVFAGLATVLLLGYAIGLASNGPASSEHPTPSNAA